MNTRLRASLIHLKPCQACIIEFVSSIFTHLLDILSFSRWNASWATVACMPISWRWFRSIPGLQIGKINLHPQQVPQHKLAESTWMLWQLWNRVTWFRIVLGQPNSILFYLYTLDVVFLISLGQASLGLCGEQLDVAMLFAIQLIPMKSFALGRSLGPMGAFGIDFWVSWVKPSTDKQWPWTVHSAACLETELQGWDFLKIEKIKRSWYQVDTLRFASFFEGSTLKFKEIINTWVSRPFLTEARIILQDVPRHCLYCRRDWIIINHKPLKPPNKNPGSKRAFMVWGANLEASWPRIAGDWSRSHVSHAMHFLLHNYNAGMLNTYLTNWLPQYVSLRLLF